MVGTGVIELIDKNKDKCKIALRSYSNFANGELTSLKDLFIYLSIVVINCTQVFFNKTVKFYVLSTNNS